MVDIPAPAKAYTTQNSIAIPNYCFQADDTEKQAALFIKDINGLSLSEIAQEDFRNNLEKSIDYSRVSYLLDTLLRDTGYISFLLLQVEMPMQEKYNLLRMAGDQYMVHFTGREPPIFSFGGILVNAYNANQLNDFIAAYNLFMRASATSKVGAGVSINYDNKRVRGQMIGMTTGIRGEQQLAGSFSFQVLVKKISLRLGDIYSVAGAESSSRVNLVTNATANEGTAGASLTATFRT